MKKSDLNINTQALTMIAHKLRTPLSIINGYCEALQTQNKNSLSPFSVKALEEIGVQGAHISHLIDKLAAFNKVWAASAQTMQKKQFFLKPLIKQSAARVLALEESLSSARQGGPESTVVRKGTFVETDCPDKLSLTADEDLLRLCVEELLTNAVKFNIKAENVIKVQGINHGDCISLSVRDYGVGIRPQDVSRIFEPFYQVDDDQTGQVTGWGLGLTMVKRILDLHNGAINVVSDRGLGSIFTVNLPIL